MAAMVSLHTMGRVGLKLDLRGLALTIIYDVWTALQRTRNNTTMNIHPSKLHIYIKLKA